MATNTSNFPITVLLQFL